MATDWSARTAAVAYFEKLVRVLKRSNDEDKEVYEAALHALRRSQDHTAIQNRLKQMKGALEEILEEFRTSDSHHGLQAKIILALAQTKHDGDRG